MNPGRLAPESMLLTTNNDDGLKTLLLRAHATEGTRRPLHEASLIYAID